MALPQDSASIQSRLDILDVARGFAASSVAVYHFGIGAPLSIMGGDWISYPGSHLAVPFFFILSGFCIHHSARGHWGRNLDFWRYIAQRFFRLYPAWLLAVVLSCLTGILAGDHYAPWSLLRYGFLINGFFEDYQLNPALWSVSVEFCLYLLYPLWLLCRHRFGLRSSLLMVAAINASSIVVFLSLGIPLRGTSLWFPTNVWLGWVVGAAVAEVWHDNRDLFRHRNWWLLGLLLWTSFVGLCIFSKDTGLSGYVRLPLVISLFAWPLSGLLLYSASLLAGLEKHSRLLHKAVLCLGLSSYSIYLLHIPLCRVFFLIDGIAPLPLTLRLLLYASCFTGVFVTSWYCYLFVEKTGISLGRRLLSR